LLRLRTIDKVQYEFVVFANDADKVKQEGSEENNPSPTAFITHPARTKLGQNTRLQIESGRKAF